MSIWSLIKLWFASLFGKSEGVAEQKQADVQEANVADQKITKAEGEAPSSRAALADRLSDLDRNV